MAEQNKDTFASTKNHPIQEINYIRPPRWSTVKEGNAWKKTMTSPRYTSREDLYYYDITSSTYELWDCNGNPLKVSRKRQRNQFKAIEPIDKRELERLNKCVKENEKEEITVAYYFLLFELLL